VIPHQGAHIPSGSIFTDAPGVPVAGLRFHAASSPLIAAPRRIRGATTPAPPRLAQGKPPNGQAGSSSQSTTIQTEVFDRRNPGKDETIGVPVQATGTG